MKRESHPKKQEREWEREKETKKDMCKKLEKPDILGMWEETMKSAETILIIIKHFSKWRQLIQIQEA